MEVLCVDFRGSDDPVDSLFLLDHDWVDIDRAPVDPAGRHVTKPQDQDENKSAGWMFRKFTSYLKVQNECCLNQLLILSLKLNYQTCFPRCYRFENKVLFKFCTSFPKSVLIKKNKEHFVPSSYSSSNKKSKLNYFLN